MFALPPSPRDGARILPLRQLHIHCFVTGEARGGGGGGGAGRDDAASRHDVIQLPNEYYRAISL